MAIKVKDTVFALQGKTSSYVFAIENDQYVRHLYWGKTIQHVENFELTPVDRVDSMDAAIDGMAEEYAPFGGLRYKSTAIKATFADGTRDLVLSYLNYTLKNDTLTIHLKDANYQLFVNLCYRVIEDEDLIERWVEVENKESADVVLEQISSASFNLPGTDYYSTQVSGHWSAEQQLFREKLTPGKKVFESRKGVSGNNHNPHFIVDRNATEDTGEVFFGALAYGGNYHVTIETTQFQSVRILLSINPFDFQYRLKSGQTFTTPSVFSGYTDQGFSRMSNTLHTFCRTSLMPRQKRSEIHPVLYNSWEATKFTFTAAEQIALAQKAAATGVELFVVDDGWFGARDHDAAGLGDWVVNKKKFPNGLNELVNAVNKLGMEFGLWIEPEAVNPDSDLYRAHPDWIYHFDRRTPSTTRNQYVLNLTRKDVQQYLRDVLDKLLTEHNITYVKWDMNRPITEPGASNLDRDDERSLWYRHTMAVYALVDALRKKHPKVTFEACSSGGSRVSYGALQHFDQFWVSDNTDALDRLYIQEGYSYMQPVKAMRAWVTDCPNLMTKKTIPLEFRFHCAMTGILGIGGHLTHYTEEELTLAKKKIAEYKQIRHIVQDGDVYRLRSLRSGSIHAMQYVLKDKESVLFVFSPGQPYIHKHHLIKLKGLDPKRTYKVEKNGETFKKNGDYLMHHGLQVTYMGDYQSEIIGIRAV